MNREKLLFRRNEDGSIDLRPIAYFQTLQSPEGGPVAVFLCLAELDPGTGRRIPGSHRQIVLNPQQAIEMGKGLQESGHKAMLRLVGGRSRPN